jgi:hypothetical protein
MLFPNPVKDGGKTKKPGKNPAFLAVKNSC